MSVMTVDVAALRGTASRLEAAQQQLEQAARRLRGAAAALAQRWKGDAADAALRQLEELARQSLRMAAAHAHAAAVLTSCARAVEEAQAAWQHARALEEQEVERRARLAARGAFVGPHDDTGLRRYAQTLAADAQVRGEGACARAAAELWELARAERPGLSASDQLAGVGRGALDAMRGSVDLVAGLLQDPRGTANGVLAGVAYGVRHPRKAVAAATGWEVLEQGRYGEWAGALLPDLLTGAVTGGAVPGARRTAGLGRQLTDLAGDTGRPDRRPVPFRTPVPGGPVRPRPGAVMTPSYPRVIRPFSPERQGHVLEGDPPPRTGGGHKFGANRGKSEFPEGWTDDVIVRRVMETALQPLSTRDQTGRRNLLAYGEYDGICVQVAVHPKGTVVTGYPVTGQVAAAGCGRGAA